MAARQEEDVYLQVKKYTFLGASGCQDRAVTDFFLQKFKDSSDEEEDEDSVKWLRVERLKRDGECVVVEKIYEQPQNVHTHIKEKCDTDCSFQYLIDAEGLMKEVDPKLQASALVTGLGAYVHSPSCSRPSPSSTLSYSQLSSVRVNSTFSLSLKVLFLTHIIQFILVTGHMHLQSSSIPSSQSLAVRIFPSTLIPMIR